MHTAPSAPRPAAPSERELAARLLDELQCGRLDLPSFPEAVTRIREVLQRDDATVDDVAAAVRGDPVFAARLVKLANSALLRRGHAAVTDLRVAIGRLGFDMVRNAAIALATRQMFQARVAPGVRRRIAPVWRRSLEVAGHAVAIARRQPVAGGDEALMAGLLHDIGRLYLVTRTADADPAAMAPVIDALHGLAGRAILEAWGFEAPLTLAAQRHHCLDRPVDDGPADLIDVVTLASWLADAADDALLPASGDACSAVARLGLDAQLLPALRAEGRADGEALAGALD